MDIGPELLARFLVSSELTAAWEFYGTNEVRTQVKISDGFSPAGRKGRHQRLLHIFCESILEDFT